MMFNYQQYDKDLSVMCHLQLAISFLTSETDISSSVIPMKLALSVNMSFIPIPVRMLIREYDISRDSLGRRIMYFLKKEESQITVFKLYLHIALEYSRS